MSGLPPLTDGKKSEGLLFLDETGTPDYFKPQKLADYHAAVAAGRKASFPIIFGLAGVLFPRRDYWGSFDAEFRALKVRHLGSDVPMHEYDLQKRKKPPFDVLRDPLKWDAFRKDLADLFSAHHFGIILCALHKPHMQTSYPPPKVPFHPYHYSLENIVERTAMESKNYAATWRVIAEDREAGLNDELKREMVRLQANGCGKGIEVPRSNVDAAEVQRKFYADIEFRTKAQNDSGLQIADLAVGPLVRRIYGLDTGDKRPLWDILEPKLCRAKDGKIRGFGAKCFPAFPSSCPF